MTEKQTRRLLIVAFVISLAVHLIVVLFVRWPFRRPAGEVQVVHIVRIRPIRIARVTPPPRTPPPAPTAAPTIVPRPAARPAGSRGTRPTAAAPISTPAAPPTPVASATPNCIEKDTPVTVAASPAPPEIPPNARTSTTGGIARVRVDVNAAGAVSSATIAQTSGDPQLDLIAMSMARAAIYAPATHDCKPIPSQYAYAVKFIPW